MKISVSFLNEPRDNDMDLGEFQSINKSIGDRLFLICKRRDSNVVAIREPDSLDQRLPIDRPCSACSAGDSNMNHHKHSPPFRQTIQIGETSLPDATGNSHGEVIKERLAALATDGQDLFN